MSGVRLKGWIMSRVSWLLVVNIYLSSVPTWAAEAPLAMIQGTVEQSRGVLEDPAYQGTENFGKRTRKLETILLPRIDRFGFAQRCLGTRWKDMSEQQRHRFVELFTKLLELSYGGMLDRYPEGVEFTYDKETIEKDYAQVDTRVFTPQRSEPFEVTYRLRRVNGQWLIYDVITDNISLARNYRSQFKRIITKSGYEGLVQALERKIVALRKAPSSD